jgi:EpsI family protein
MTDRRELLIGGACFATAGLAFGLQPRRRVSLLRRGQTIGQLTPRAFGGWMSRDVTDLVAPVEPQSLAARLYGESVGRVYGRPGADVEIMMLLAHGDSQTDELQLHRPEVCYPAFGFAISQTAPVPVPLARDVSLPCRRLVADAPDRRESIIYWSRLGEFLPTDRAEQQWARVKTVMRGVIADGLLARFSILGSDSGAAFELLTRFIPEFIRAVGADHRSVLIGSRRAGELAAEGV